MGSAKAMMIRILWATLVFLSEQLSSCLLKESITDKYSVLTLLTTKVGQTTSITLLLSILERLNEAPPFSPTFQTRLDTISLDITSSRFPKKVKGPSTLPPLMLKERSSHQRTTSLIRHVLR